MAEPWEMYQQQAAQPAAPPPAAPAAAPPAQTPDTSSVEPWQLYQQQAAPSPAQPAAAPTTPTTPDDSGIPSLSDVVHNYIQGVKQRVGSTPAEFGHNVVTRLTDLNQGLAQHVDRSMLTIERAARAVDQAHGLFTNGHPLDAQIAHDEAVVNAPRPTDPERAGSQQLGDDAGSVIEYMLGEGALKSLGVMDKIEALQPISKAIRRNPMVAKVLRTMIEQGTVGTAQAGVQGASLPDALTSGAEAAAVGGLTEAPQARVGARAATAAELAPTEMDVRGVPATILASELPGATPRQTAAATIAETPALRQARQEAWQQLPVNLAKDAVTNGLNESNNASVADLRQRLRDTEDPDLEQQLTQQLSDIRAGGAGAPAWSYLTPEGASLSPAQTRSAMNALREHWLSQDFSPADDQAIQDRYNDMKDQLDRYDTMQGTQPVGPIYNVADAADNTSSFADAANHMRIVGDRALAEMPQRFRNDYTNIADQRAKLQDDFDANAGVPKLQAPIEKEIARLNTRMNTILQEPDVMDAISQPRAEQALKDKRLSDAFQALHNVMTKHVTLTPEESTALGTPSEARGSRQSLINDIRALQDQYGDVLNPAIGDRGLNHILDLGQYMQMPQGNARVQSLLGNMVMVLRRHFQGMRGMASSGGATVGAYTLAHLLGHVTGATSLGIGALGAEAQAARTRYKLATDPVFNRMIRDRMSTDPNFMNRFIFGAKFVPPRHAAPLLGAMITAPGMTAPPPENQNAPSQRNP
jgi:hypothetical protein